MLEDGDNTLRQTAAGSTSLSCALSPTLDVSLTTPKVAGPTSEHTPPPHPSSITDTTDVRTPCGGEGRGHVLSPITLSQVTFLELSTQADDSTIFLSPTAMADQVLSDFGLKELTEQDLKDFSNCSTQDTSLGTTGSTIGASSTEIHLSNSVTEIENPALQNVSCGFLPPQRLPSSTASPVTYHGRHDNMSRPSSVHFPGPQPIPSPVSHGPQTGTLLGTKLKHPNRRIPLDIAMCGERPGAYSRQQLALLGVCPSVLEVTSGTAGLYRFKGSRHFSEGVQSGSVEVCIGDGAMVKVGSDGCVGAAELWDAFSRSPGIDPSLVSEEWFSNHYRWVVWKLAAMEVGFPRRLAGRCLTPDWLMLQMKYRYDREIDMTQRPALRKICEGDDVPSRTMVLCISHVDHELLASDQTQTSFGNDSKAAALSPDPPCVRVTDGWYSLPGVLDGALKHAVRRGAVRVGTKVITSGAELVGGAGPCHPLEASPTLALKLSANSTRRVRWFAKLGYHRCPLPIHVPLASVLPAGGLVGSTVVVVCRVYPVVYMERLKEKGVVFRSRRAEEHVDALHQARRQRDLEKVYQRVQREMEDELAQAGMYRPPFPPPLFLPSPLLSM